MLTAIDYAQPGPLTDLTSVSAAVLDDLPADPVEICRLLPGLVVHPLATDALGLPAERFDENQLRPAASILTAALHADPGPLDLPRAADRRVVGTCRHFAVLGCALLRYRGIDRPQDLQPGEFLTGGEAWAACRAGAADPAAFGVYGTENFGPAEIRGNVIRDPAALNKTEMLPWDEWGRMTASYRGETGAEYDGLMDAVASACAGADPAAARDAYAWADLRVPPELSC